MPEDEKFDRQPAAELPPKIPGVLPPAAPTDSPRELWNLDSNGKLFGPYTREQMKEFIAVGRVAASSKIIKAGVAGWRRADSDPVLKQLLAGETPAAVLSDEKNNAAETATLIIRASNAEVKSTLLAVVLSVVLTGAGQMYVGRIGKGIGFMICGFFFILLWGLTFKLMALPAVIIYIWAIIDAHNTARQLNIDYQVSLMKKIPQ